MALDKRNSPTRRGDASHRPHGLYARIRGGVEYVCPHCGRFQKTKVNYRRPRHRCHNKQCNRMVEFGIAATAAFGSAPPHNGYFAPPLPAGEPRNVTSSRSLKGGLTAQITGPVELWCRDCNVRIKATPVRGVGSIHCPECRNVHFLALIVRSTTPGAHSETPPDWIPPNV